MRSLALLSLIAMVAAHGASQAASEQLYGAFGPEGARMREQLWILPSGEPGKVLRATVFRPDDLGEGKEPASRPMVVINHGTDEATRLSVSMPVYYWLSRWFVERGYIVVLPQRRGHGATGGPLSEAVGNCQNPDHYASGVIAADDIAATIAYMSQQTFVQHDGIVVAGISTGGWASLALAARNPAGVMAIVNFAGGRGGHAFGRANAVCGLDNLERAATTYGRTARVPSIWYYSENDSYFSPRLASQLATGWRNAGGNAETHFLPAYGDDGHGLADDRAGWELWGSSLERFLSAKQEQLVAQRSHAAERVSAANLAPEQQHDAPVVATAGGPVQ